MEGNRVNEHPTQTTGGTTALDEPSLYLDLLKTVLTRSGFPNSYSLIAGKKGIKRLFDPAQALLGFFHLAIVRRPAPGERGRGADWPSDAETMVGRLRLDNIEFCVRDVLKKGVVGDFIETGVWRGGASIFMRAILQQFHVVDRTVWLADSFQGLPKPSSTRERNAMHLWKYPELAVSLEEVKTNFRRYGLLDEQVRFLPGWFSVTLPSAPIERLALLRLDGDMYESTMTALESLYDKVSLGGYVIVDDYLKIQACRDAVDEYRARLEITDEIRPIDRGAVFWRKSG